MRKLLHISDLHFGRVDDGLLAPLHRLAEDLDPHVIAISGDLTQRARTREFEAARDYIATFRAPKVVVPGNHDIPLYDVVRRFARPLARYARFLGTDIEPTYVDSELVVVGINTARSWAFKGGRINRDQAARARDSFCRVGENVTKVLVSHHPFDVPQTAGERELVGRSDMAMAALRDCTPDLLLSGHLHVHRVGSTAERYSLGGKAAIVVQAGTATSTRGRGESNSVNLISIERPRIAVERFDWIQDKGTFLPASRATFELRDGVWETSVAAQ